LSVDGPVPARGTFVIGPKALNPPFEAVARSTIYRAVERAA
jgi:hypothetical protein